MHGLRPCEAPAWEERRRTVGTLGRNERGRRNGREKGAKSDLGARSGGSGVGGRPAGGGPLDAPRVCLGDLEGAARMTRRQAWSRRLGKQGAVVLLMGWAHLRCSVWV